MTHETYSYSGALQSTQHQPAIALHTHSRRLQSMAEISVNQAKSMVGTYLAVLLLAVPASWAVAYALLRLFSSRPSCLCTCSMVLVAVSYISYTVNIA